jgi:hypothetical protein
VTYPVLRAVARGRRDLTILHVDAHPDLYDEFEGDRYSHACPFARTMEEGLARRLVQVGIRTMNAHQRRQADRFGVEVIDMRGWQAGVRPRTDGPVYLSIDLDGLDPAFAPGVSHRDPGGLSVREVLDLVQGVGGVLVGADIVEYNPRQDIGGVTAMVAAKLVKEVAGRMLEEDPKDLVTHEEKVCAKDGRFVTYSQVCLSSLYQQDQFQIMATASHMSYDSPPPFAAVFAEVEVDTETGLVRVVKVVEAVDCGQVVNPQMAEGQIEGAAVMGIGMALFEQTEDDPRNGAPINNSLADYVMAVNADVPASEVRCLDYPDKEINALGARGIGEIGLAGIAAAITDAVHPASGVRVRELPVTIEDLLV